MGAPESSPVTFSEWVPDCGSGGHIDAFFEQCRATTPDGRTWILEVTNGTWTVRLDGDDVADGTHRWNRELAKAAAVAALLAAAAPYAS